MRKTFYFLSLVAVFATLVSCDDESVVGSGLVDNESLNVKLIDTLDLKARTILSEPLPTYVPSRPKNTYMLGQIEDPIFGTTRSEIYFSPTMFGGLPQYDTPNSVFDSLVLVLPLSEAGNYGNLGNHTLEVFRVTESIESADTIYGDQDFDTESSPIARLENKFVDAGAETKYINHATGEEDTIIGQLRIKFDDAFGSMLFEDATAATTDSAFRAEYNGFKIVSTTNDNSIFGLRLGTIDSQVNGNLEMYYSTDDTTKTTFSYSINSVRSSRFTTDASGTQVENAIDDWNLGDQALYLQSMTGPHLELDLSSIEPFAEDKLFNNVSVDLFVAELVGDDISIYPPIENLIALYPDEDGVLQPIEDLDVSLRDDQTILDLVQLDLERIFGGDLSFEEENNMLVRKYSLNITLHIQEQLRNNSNNFNIIVLPFLQPERPTRSVIYGPEHPNFPAKLKVLFTENP